MGDSFKGGIQLNGVDVQPTSKVTVITDKTDWWLATNGIYDQFRFSKEWTIYFYAKKTLSCALIRYRTAFLTLWLQSLSAE
jgi:hypothetical protein